MSANSNDYAGDVSARAAWADLEATAEATLIDVRTRAEWIYVGVPLLSALNRAPLLVEAELARAGIGNEAPLYFLCRSGARSRNAAVLATAAGHARSYNIEFGFEGRLSPERHRATPGSWKAEGLPWVQS